jgi:type I restriction enzyme, R subunit
MGCRWGSLSAKPFVTDPMAEGINQLRRYANLRNPSDTEGCEKLFHYNQVMVSTFRDGARVGTISSPVEYYLEWKDPYPTDAKELGSPANAQQLLIQGLLNPATFLDIIQNCTLYETDSGRTIKKIARYQQFRAVQKTIKRLRSPGVALYENAEDGLHCFHDFALNKSELRSRILQVALDHSLVP